MASHIAAARVGIPGVDSVAANIQSGGMNLDPRGRGKRLFIAIDPPDYTRQRLAGLRAELRGFHWVDPDRLHLTLKFIGDTSGQEQEAISAALAGIKVGAFMLPVQGVGAFPAGARTHAVWVGLEHGHPRLFQLHKRIEDALFAIGIEPEKRAYQPHLTIARVGPAAPETIRQYLKRHQDFATAPFRVTAFHLYRSEATADGRRHVVEQSWPLHVD
jgi:2'-5' RNA ligase